MKPFLSSLFLVLFVLAGNACGASEGASAPSETGPAKVKSPSPPTPDPPESDASAPDPSVDSGPPNPYAGGFPITAPAGTWTYVPMNDLVCGNGSTSGIAVNMSPVAGAPLLVFMMGGGACWDTATCLGGTASNLLQAVGEPEIMADIPRVAPLFDRSAASNPFRNATHVFVPYCTADLHAGNAQRTYTLVPKSMTVQHRGARNTDAVLKRLRATFPAPPKVWLTGASGGGYGAMLNHHRFKAAWPGVRLDLLNDCAPPMQPTGSFWADMQSSWKLELPPGCVDCATDVTKLMPHLAAEMGPQSRLALSEFTADQTIRSFTGRLVAQDFTNRLLAVRSSMGPRQRTFFVDGDSHVLLKQNPLPVASSGVSMATWLNRFANDDPAWAHEGP